MMVLITYDVATSSDDGQRRLRKVAKKCEDYGQRVQNSVFECLIEPQDFVKLKSDLDKIISPEKDSLRYYFLGSNWKKHVEHIGVRPGYDPEGTLII